MRTLVSCLAVLAATSGALGGEGDMLRVRGTIEQASPTGITVKSREGADINIVFMPSFKVTGVKAASATDIKAGDFVGVASLPTADGGAGALEVVIFPAALPGSATGSFPWDLQPNSTMTNAAVSNAVENVNGRSLTLTYPDGSKTITLRDDIPIVTLGDATMADLVVGAPVFISTVENAAGALTAKSVIVGSNGVAPPM